MSIFSAGIDKGGDLVKFYGFKGGFEFSHLHGGCVHPH